MQEKLDSNFFYDYVSLIKNGTKWVYSPGFDYTISGLYAAKKLANIVEKKMDMTHWKILEIDMSASGSVSV
jgi:hypothetical protein